MNKSDRLLIGIILGVFALVVLAVVLAVTRPEPEYRDDETPEAVAHNYLLALQMEDYQRAHTYLSRWLPGYPLTASDFEGNIRDNAWNFRLGQDRTLTVLDMHVMPLEATVTVRETVFYGSGLFESGQGVGTFDLEFRLEQGDWKISGGDRYFAYCWAHENGCR